MELADAGADILTGELAGNFIPIMVNGIKAYKSLKTGEIIYSKSFRVNSGVGDVSKGGDKAYQGVRDLTVDFKNGTKLESHFIDHGSDFAFETADEYLTAARDFVMKESTSTTQSFVSEGGTYFRYNTATNEFGIVNQYGGVSTYFKPANGLEYWLEQIEMYKPK